MSEEGIEAVGRGIVSAKINEPQNCLVTLAINGMETDSVAVEDGDSITVELYTDSECQCCETKRDCNSRAVPLFMQSGKNKMSLNRNELMRRIKFAIK
jgi:hypothetical protein